MKLEPNPFQARCISYVKCLENTFSKILFFQRLKKNEAIFFSILRGVAFFTPYKNGRILKYRRLM